MSEPRDFAEMARKREIEASKLSDDEIRSYMALNILRNEDMPKEMKFDLIINSLSTLNLVISNISQVYEEGVIEIDEYSYLINEFSKLINNKDDHSYDDSID